MRLGRVIFIFMFFISFVSAEELINLNFKNMEIKKFVEMVAKIADKNILMQGNIKGKVDFIAQKPIKKSELMPLVISILEAKGFTIVKSSSGVWKVVRSAKATGEGLSVSSKGETSGA